MVGAEDRGWAVVRCSRDVQTSSTATHPHSLTPRIPTPPGPVFCSRCKTLCIALPAAIYSTKTSHKDTKAHLPPRSRRLGYLSPTQQYRHRLQQHEVLTHAHTCYYVNPPTTPTPDYAPLAHRPSPSHPVFPHTLKPVVRLFVFLDKLLFSTGSRPSLNNLLTAKAQPSHCSFIQPCINK